MYFNRLAGRRFGLTLLLIAALFAGAHALNTAPTPTRTAGITPAYAADPDGQQLYMTRCMSCHQMNGNGIPGVFPPVDDSEWVTGDKDRLIRVVLHGLSGEIKVGDATYSGAMPPWGSFLSDEETAALLTYIRTSWSNDASTVTPEEVAAVRAATKDRKKPWTAEELAAATKSEK